MWPAAPTGWCMCDPRGRLLAVQHRTVASLSEAYDALDDLALDLVELVQAQTALRYESTAAARDVLAGEVTTELVGGRAVGALPRWYVRGVARADARELVIRWRLAELEPGRVELAAFIWADARRLKRAHARELTP